MIVRLWSLEYTTKIWIITLHEMNLRLWSSHCEFFLLRNDLHMYGLSYVLQNLYIEALTPISQNVIMF